MRDRSTRALPTCRPCALNRWRIATLLLSLALFCVGTAAADAGTPLPFGHKVPRAQCAMLDDPEIRPLMDGLLVKLLLACGREHELGQVRQEPSQAPVPGSEGPGSGDVLVNDPSGDAGGSSHTQSETAIAYNPVTGTLCSGYNDSFHGVVNSDGFAGFSRSTDGGLTFTDQGPLGANSGGDPALVWRRADGHIYYAALETNGLGVWRSSDDCQTFQYLGNTHTSGGDDKEFMAVDNNPASSFYGRLYVAWTDFNAGGIFLNFSDDGTTWSSALSISGSSGVQGAWPAVAPNGDVFVGWVRFAGSVIDIEVTRSTDGGVSATRVTNPLTGGVLPQDNAATSNCGRTALNGNIRYLPSPQLVVGPDGALHVVYSRDPDNGGPDSVDAYYRRSTDSGTSWGPEVRLNDDTSNSDQFFPTLSIGETNIVSAAWYDRRNDAANLLSEYFTSLSFDGGVTWQPSSVISDVATPIYIDPSLATCYHGDYDQQLQTEAFAVIQWADDRNMQDGHNDPDVYVDQVPLSTDFLVLADPLKRSVCAPDDAPFAIDVPQFSGFSEAVTLSTGTLPAGLAAAFVPNPVTPPGTSNLTLSGTGGPGAGSYPIAVIGTSTPSNIVQQTTITLDIFDQLPAVPAPTTPADGATGVALSPVLAWTAATQAELYEVELADDATFTNILFTTTTADTQQLVGIVLASETTYYWRLRASNLCGTGADSATFSFTTRPVPPVLLVDDDDNSPDVRATYEGALTTLGLDFDVWDTANSDTEPTAPQLAPYRLVVWFTGDEFGGAAGPGAAGEAALTTWLEGSGECLFLSSQDYHFDRGATPFISDYLKASVTDDVTQTSATGQGPTFGGLGPYALSYPFSNFSDTVSLIAPAVVAFSGNVGDAAVQHDSGTYRTFFLGFPFETLPTPGQEAVLGAVVDTCGLGGPDPSIFDDGFESGDASGWSTAVGN